MLSNFDFEMEYANLRVKYPSVSVERSEYFCEFLKHLHCDAVYRDFLCSLSDDEYFFCLALQCLL